MIRTLDPKQNQGSGPEVQALKNQLQEKERMLHSLEVIECWHVLARNPVDSQLVAQQDYFRTWITYFLFNFPYKQKEMDKTKGQRDYEEKLIVSAWYNMVRRTCTALSPLWLVCHVDCGTFQCTAEILCELEYNTTCLNKYKRQSIKAGLIGGYFLNGMVMV